jgi:hypothetical protein
MNHITYCRLCNSKHEFPYAEASQHSRFFACSECQGSGEILATKPLDLNKPRLITHSEQAIFEKHLSSCCAAPVHLSDTYGKLLMREAICSNCTKPFLARTANSPGGALPELVVWRQVSACCGSKSKIIVEKGKYERICGVCKGSFVLLEAGDEPMNPEGPKIAARNAKKSERSDVTIGCLFIVAIIGGLIWFVIWVFGQIFPSGWEGTPGEVPTRPAQCRDAIDIQYLNNTLTDSEYLSQLQNVCGITN